MQIHLPGSNLIISVNKTERHKNIFFKSYKNQPVFFQNEELTKKLTSMPKFMSALL